VAQSDEMVIRYPLARLVPVDSPATAIATRVRHRPHWTEHNCTGKRLL